ncbi:hypothetical protein GJAV_G00039410 [Gymnothorax javanicus]|nr:hypothetical protein GJAV_G00039410 [Gymnothorax javanicus]
MDSAEEEKRKDNKLECINPKQINIAAFPALKDYLPAGYNYHVCEFKNISETNDHVNFRATLRMALSTVEEIKLWLKSHTVTWRVDRTIPRKGQKVLYKVVFRCQHKTRPRGIESVPGRSKNINCSAKMTVTLVRSCFTRQSLSRDPHVPTFPTMVTICNDHNHSIYEADALRHSDVGYETEEKLSKLYDAGHSPGSALHVFKYHLDGSDEASHRAATVGFAEMCQKLVAIINSDSSYTAAAVAAVKAFNKIKDSPSKIISALHTFGRNKNTGSASARSRAVCRAVRHAGPAIHAQPTAVARRELRLGGRRHLVTGRPRRLATGPDHVYGQPAEEVRTPAPHYLANSVLEGESHPK